MGNLRCDSNISAIRVPSVWRISVICLVVRLHLVTSNQIPVCTLNVYMVDMASDVTCAWSTRSSICSSLGDCSTKTIVCDSNKKRISFTCRIMYERKGQKCINMTRTSKYKRCFYSNGSRLHDRDGCINESGVRCYSSQKCDSKCKVYALKVESASEQGNDSLKETNEKNQNEVSDAVSAGTKAAIVSAVLLFIVLAVVLSYKPDPKTLHKRYQLLELRPASKGRT